MDADTSGLIRYLLLLISWHAVLLAEEFIYKFSIDNFSDQREQEFKSFTEVCFFQTPSSLLKKC